MNNTPLGCVKYKINFFFHKWTYYTSIIYTFNSSSGNVPFLAAPDIFFSFVEYSERLFLRHHLKKRRQMHKQQNNSNMADIRKTIVVITTVCPADTFCLEYSEKKNVYWQWNEFICELLTRKAAQINLIFGLIDIIFCTSDKWLKKLGASNLVTIL